MAKIAGSAGFANGISVSIQSESAEDFINEYSKLKRKFGVVKYKYVSPQVSYGTANAMVAPEQEIDFGEDTNGED